MQDQLTEILQELAFQPDGVLVIAVIFRDVHRIDMGGAGRGNVNHYAAHGCNEVRVLLLRVDENNIIIRPAKHDIGDHLHYRERLAVAGHAQHHTGRGGQQLAVTQYQILTAGVDALVQPARLEQLLRGERYIDGRADGLQRALQPEPLPAQRQHTVHSVALLIQYTVEATGLLLYGAANAPHTLVQLRIGIAIGVNEDADFEDFLVFGCNVIHHLLCVVHFGFQIIAHSDAGRHVSLACFGNGIVFFFVHISKFFLDFLDSFCLVHGVNMHCDDVVKRKLGQHREQTVLHFRCYAPQIHCLADFIAKLIAVTVDGTRIVMLRVPVVRAG